MVLYIILPSSEKGEQKSITLLSIPTTPSKSYNMSGIENFHESADGYWYEGDRNEILVATLRNLDGEATEQRKSLDEVLGNENGMIINPFDDKSDKRRKLTGSPFSLKAI